MLGLSVSIVQSQELLNSWENSLEGWSVIQTSTWTHDGFSTNSGVTDGSYSLQLTTTAVDWGQTLQGPTSSSLALLMANAASVSMDILVGTNTPPNFGWGFQIDLEVNQPGGVGTLSVNNYYYEGIYSPQLGSGQVVTVTWPVLQAVRTALNAYPNLPCYLTLSVGGGGGGTVYFDNLRVNKIAQTQANLWVRELWDGLGSDKIPANVTAKDYSSSAGFSADDPWVVNAAETANCTLMAFRTLSTDEPLAGDLKFGLPTSLDGTFGSLVQENGGFSYFPGEGGKSFWTDGDFMTRLLKPECYINFNAVGEYWFAVAIANKPWDGSVGSLYSQYVVFPSSGWGGIGFANGDSTNADFVAIGATGLNVYYGATNVSAPWGETNASKALYISQGTLGQAGNVDTTLYSPANDPMYNGLYTGGVYTDEPFSQTNFSGGPYHINALAQGTVGQVSGDYLTLLGHLKTYGDGTATLDAKYYGVGVGGNSWNTELDTDPASITWDCSYAFNFNGTMTRLLLFQNGQFPFYMHGLRASTKFSDVVGLDRGYIKVAPLTDTYVGFAINMTNLAVEANSYSWSVPPVGYGTLDYQWYHDGAPIGGATQRHYSIGSATTNDAGMYTCVATDPSGTWGSVTSSVAVTVTALGDPLVAGVELFRNQHGFLVTFDQPNLAGAGDLTHYVFDNGITVTNVTVVNGSLETQVYLDTLPMPLGTKIQLTIDGITNVVGGTLAATNLSMWTDLIKPGVANWDAWLYPAGANQNDYFNNFVPANPTPTILQSMSLSSWQAPTDGITIVGNTGVGDDYGSKVYGWFVPPVTTNYVFYIACDDGGRLMLSTNQSPANLRVVACESLWNGGNQWTNICDQYPGPGVPHRGDGTANGASAVEGYVWDNSVAGQSPATACLQNRSDQFIVAFYDSSMLPGGPPGATTSWAGASSQVTDCVPSGMTNSFWPNRDVNGQALVSLQAGEMYYMELEHVEIGGGQNAAVTYKIAGGSDPLSPSSTALAGSVISGTAAFTPSISIAQTGSGPVITYTGVLLAGPGLDSITNVVGQSSGSTAISLGGPSQYVPPNNGGTMFYRTSE